MTQQRQRFNPFPGLRPFRMDEKHLFFGREDQTRELLQRLRDNRFLAVVGTSGSGKSSLVQAGLLPQLYGGTMLDAGFQWEVAVMRPGGDPLTHLAEALVETDLYDPDRDAAILETRATLSRSGLGLVEAVRQSDIEAGSNLLVVVDQFEELFRFRGGSAANLEEASAFVNLLLRAADQNDIPIYIALTMRSDYLGDCAEFAGLAEAVNDGEYLIPRLSRQQRRSAIAGPVKVGGGRIAPRLLQKLLNDVGDNPDHLPVLQHALMRTWDHWEDDHTEDEPIDLRHYESVGAMEEALSRHADEVYAELADDTHRSIAEKIFKALTERSVDNRGIRRPGQLRKLCAVADTDEETAASIIEAFRKMGRTFLMPTEGVPLQAETVIDISHESLMRVWRRLDGWVEEESQSASIYRRLHETAELHADGKAGLYHDPDLQIAQSWREESEPNEAWASQYGGRFESTLAFLQQSEDSARRLEREREAARLREIEQAQALAKTQQGAARNFRRFAVGMGVVALLALGAFGIALQKGSEAEESKEKAEQARIVAEQLKISAEKNEEQTNREFALSDATIGHSFLSPGAGERRPVAEDVGRGVAHLARSLRRDGIQPTITDRIFNVFAHEAPPLYRMLESAHGEALGAPRRPLHASVATADASVVAWTTRHRKVLVWNSKSPGDFREWETDASILYHGLELDRDGKHLFIGKYPVSDPELIDLDAWRRLPFENQGRNDLRSRPPRFSTRGDRYLIRTADQGIQLCDTKTGAFLKRLESSAAIDNLGVDPVLSPTERHLARLKDQGDVLLTYHSISVAAVADKSDGQAGLPAVKLVAPSPLMAIPRVAFSPDGTHLLATTNSDGKASILVWRIDAPDPEFSASHELVPSGLSGKQDSTRGAYYNEGGFRDFSSEAIAEGAPDLDDCYIVGAFTPDGQRLLTAGMDRTVRLWSTATGIDQASRLQDSVAIQDQIAWNCEPLFSRDGRRFMIRTRDYGCLLGRFGKDKNELPPLVRRDSLVEGYAFLADSGKIKPLLLACDRVTSGSVHPRDPIIALGTADGTVSFLDLRTGEGLATTTAGHHGVVVDLGFNRDGSRLAARSDSGSLREWDISKVREGLSLIAVEEGGMGSADRAAGFAVGKDVLAASSDGSWVLRRGGQLLSAPIGDDGGNGAGVFLQSASPNPIETAKFSSDARFVATASADDNFLQVFSTATGEKVIPPLPHDKKIINSLGFSPDGKMLAAGSQSGAVHLWKLPTGESADHLEINGASSCTDVVFGPRGRLLATVFEGGSESYVQIWDAGTGQAISERLSNGSRLSRAVFIEDGTRLVAWPQKQASGGSAGEQQAGWASVWDVSVSGGEAPPPWFSEVATSFGGIRLDEQSNIERVEKRVAPAKIAGGSSTDGRLARFFEWLTLFPGSRPDSPFREHPSDSYVESLVDQTSFEFLDEAIRLRPDDARALARRGVLRLPAVDEVDPGTGVLSTVDVTRARLLDSDDTELAWYEGIAMEVAGHGDDADAAYAAARKLPPMELEALGRVIEIQESYAAHLGEGGQRELLDQALMAAQVDEKIDKTLAARWLIRRFLLATKFDRFAEAERDWQVIKELGDIDEGWSRQLLATYLEVATSEAERLIGDGKPDAAVRLLEPVALLAELDRVVGPPEDSTDHTPTAALALLGEWRHVGGADVEFIAAGSEWAYFDKGIDQGIDWRKLDFDDSGWDRGKAKLGYGSEYGDPIETRLDYGSDKDAKYPTTYFRREFFVADGEQREFVKIDVVRDDGVIIYLNGEHLWRDNMPTGQVEYGDFASERNGGEQGAYHRSTRSGRGLRVGRNVIAAEVHQAGGQSSDIAFELCLEGTDSSPWAHLDQRLRGDEGGRLQEAATELLPLRLRERWQAVLKATFSDEVEATPRHREEVALAAFSLQKAWDNWDGALATAQAAVRRLAPVEGKSTPVQTRRRKEWLGRVEDQLVGLNRPEPEIEAVKSELLGTPPRDPALDPKLIDLSDHYTASLYDDRAWIPHSTGNFVLAQLPETFVPLHGVDFDLRGTVQLNSGVYPSEIGGIGGKDLKQKTGRPYPDAIPSIEVNQRSPAIHFLMSCTYGHEEPNVEVARLEIHFDDGVEPEVKRIRFGDHIVNWAKPRTLANPAVIGWRGTLANGDRVALSEIVWRNPHPDKTISHVDFISNLKLAAPFLVGITLE